MALGDPFTEYGAHKMLESDKAELLEAAVAKRERRKQRRLRELAAGGWGLGALRRQARGRARGR